MFHIYWLNAAQQRFREAMDTPLSPPAQGQIGDTVCGKLAATLPIAVAAFARTESPWRCKAGVPRIPGAELIVLLLRGPD
jgi:hypothetical protein